MVAGCRPDITPITCVQSLASIAADARAVEAESRRIERLLPRPSDIQRQSCDQDRASLNALRALAMPRPRERYSEQELRDAPRLIAETERRLAAANCP